MDLRSVSPDHFSDSFLQQMSSSWKHREELHFVLAAPFQKKTLLKKKFSIEKSLCLAEDLLQVRFWMRRDLNQAAVNLTKPLANLFFCKQLVSTCSYFSFVQETFFTDPILFTQELTALPQGKESGRNSKGSCCEHFRWSLQVLSGVLSLAPTSKPARTVSRLHTDHSFSGTFRPYAFHLIPILSQYDLYDYIIPKGYCRCFASEWEIISERDTRSTWRKSKSVAFKIGLKELGQFSFKKRKWSGDSDSSLQTQEDCCKKGRKNLFCISMRDGTGSRCRSEMQLRCENRFF